MDKLLILGAGGFGQMVKETAAALGYKTIVFLDDAAKGADVVGKCCDYIARREDFDVAVAAFGNNNTRLYWTDKLLQAGYEVPAIVHPMCSYQSQCCFGNQAVLLCRGRW